MTTSIDRWPERVAVVGAAGTVGAAVTATIAHAGIADTIVVVDENERLLRAHITDITESTLLAAGSRTKIAMGRASDLEDIDLLILTAAAVEDPRQGRDAPLVSNVKLVRQMLSSIVQALGQRGVLIVVSNPVDILCDVIRRLSPLAPRRIVGYSLNDTNRFRIAVARELSVEPHLVDACVLGQHGGIQVPLFSRVRIDGARVMLSSDRQRRVVADISSWFSRWVELDAGRSTGWATAAGVGVVCRRLIEGGVLPLSVASAGSFDLPDTFVTLPAVLERSGVTRVDTWTLDRSERQQLQGAATSVKTVVDGVMTTS